MLHVTRNGALSATLKERLEEKERERRQTLVLVPRKSEPPPAPTVTEAPQPESAMPKSKRRKRRVFSAEDKARIAARVHAGESVRAVARDEDVQDNSVRLWSKQLAKSSRPARKQRGAPPAPAVGSSAFELRLREMIREEVDLALARAIGGRL